MDIKFGSIVTWDSGLRRGRVVEVPKLEGCPIWVAILGNQDDLDDRAWRPVPNFGTVEAPFDVSELRLVQLN